MGRLNAGGELANAGFDNWPAVLGGFAGLAVDPAKPSAPHASGNAVIGGSLARFEELAARIWWPGPRHLQVGRLRTSGRVILTERWAYGSVGVRVSLGLEQIQLITAGVLGRINAARIS